MNPESVGQSRRVMTARRWLQNSLPGSQMIYHRGFLAEERILDDDLETIARLMWAGQALGSVVLSQRRAGTEYEYVATKKGLVHER